MRCVSLGPADPLLDATHRGATGAPRNYDPPRAKASARKDKPHFSTATLYLSAHRRRTIFPSFFLQAISSDAEFTKLSREGKVGAGGLGTERVMLKLQLADSKAAMHIFAKLPAITFFEAVFMKLFCVYKNELQFYQLLQKIEFVDKFRPGLFPVVHHASMKRGRFVLVLEDLSKSRKARFPPVTAPNPASHVRKTLSTFADLHAPCYGNPPATVWTDKWSAARLGSTPTRPPFLQLIVRHTLKEVLSLYPGLLSKDFLVVYELFLKHFQTVRRAWSSGVLTLVHGDAHLGNTFVHKGEDGQDKVGLLDFQCVAAEHPMRDVCYHMLSSCDPAMLSQADTEKDLGEWTLLGACVSVALIVASCGMTCSPPLCA